MNLSELDSLLNKWQKDVQLATSNLVAFEESSAYKAAKTVLPTLTGQTKQVIGPAISGIEGVWELLTQINAIVKEAGQLRQSMPLAFGRSDRIKQIENLLTGLSITLQVKEIPLEERGLTGASHLTKMSSLPDVFAMMQNRFIDANKAIAKYNHSFEELSAKIQQFEGDLQTKFGGDTLDLSAIQDVLYSDPLTGLELVSQIKKKKRIKIEPESLPSAGGSLHAFLSQKEIKVAPIARPQVEGISSIKESLPITVSPVVSQPINDSNSKLTDLFGSEAACEKQIPVSNPRKPEPVLSSIEQLLSEGNPRPTADSAAPDSLENLFADKPHKTEPAPSTTLENLFGS